MDVSAKSGKKDPESVSALQALKVRRDIVVRSVKTDGKTDFSEPMYHLSPTCVCQPHPFH